MMWKYDKITENSHYTVTFLTKKLKTITVQRESCTNNMIVSHYYNFNVIMCFVFLSLRWRQYSFIWKTVIVQQANKAKEQNTRITKIFLYQSSIIWHRLQGKCPLCSVSHSREEASRLMAPGRKDLLKCFLRQHSSVNLLKKKLSYLSIQCCGEEVLLVCDA